MPAQPSSEPQLDLPLEPTAALPAEPVPSNRAARRRKGSKHQVPDQARYQPMAHARPQQGRRINPVRRTG